MLIKLLSKDDKESLISLAEFLSISDKPMLWNGESMDEASARIHNDDVKFYFARGEAESSLLADWRKIPAEGDASGIAMPTLNHQTATPSSLESERSTVIPSVWPMPSSLESERNTVLQPGFWPFPTSSSLESRRGAVLQALKPKRRYGCYEKGATEAEKDLIDLLREVPLKLDNAAPEVRASAVSTVLRKIYEENKVSSNYAIRIVLFELMLMAFADGKISTIELYALRDLQHHYGVDDESFCEILEQAEAVSKVSQRTLALILE